MENQEEILDVLTVFEKKPSRNIPPVLEDYLSNVAKTGKTLFPWNRLKPLFINKLEQVMEQLNKDMPYDHLPSFPNVENSKYEDMKKRIIDALQKFNGAPFTVQRICELVTDPTKHYTRCDKFLRGIEKNVMVVSTVDPLGRKIASESYRGALVNGLDLNGFNQQKADASDINDGQPFVPLPLTDWSSNSLASVWPLAIGNGSEIPKPHFSDPSRQSSLASDINLNINNNNNEEGEIDEDESGDNTTCEAGDDKYTDNDASNTIYTGSAFGNKDLVDTSDDHPKDNSEDHPKESELTTDSAVHVSETTEVKAGDTDSNISLNHDAAPFKFETKELKSDNVVDSTAEKPSNSDETEASSDKSIDIADVNKESEQEESVDEHDADGPPEKKMKLTEDHSENVSTTVTDGAQTKLEDTSTATVSEEAQWGAEKNEVIKQSEQSANNSPSDTENTDHPDEGDVKQTDTSTVSSQPDLVTSSDQDHTSKTVTEEIQSQTDKEETADSSSETSNVENNDSINDDKVDKIRVDDSDVKPDTSSVDGTASEAMETEQAECESSDCPAEISDNTNEPEDNGNEPEDGPEPMDQE